MMSDAKFEISSLVLWGLRFAAPIVSGIALVLYFAPWWRDPRDGLDAFMLGFLWFLIAWIPMVAQIIIAIVQARRRDREWKDHLVAAAFVGVAYVIFFVALNNDYFATV